MQKLKKIYRFIIFKRCIPFKCLRNNKFYSISANNMQSDIKHDWIRMTSDTDDTRSVAISEQICCQTAVVILRTLCSLDVYIHVFKNLQYSCTNVVNIMKESYNEGVNKFPGCCPSHTRKCLKCGFSAKESGKRATLIAKWTIVYQFNMSQEWMYNVIMTGTYTATSPTIIESQISHANATAYLDASIFDELYFMYVTMILERHLIVMRHLIVILEKMRTI